MPLYEGLSEKQAVVIDIGAEYTRFGFAGESGPRCIVRTEIKNPDTKEVRKLLNYSNQEELYDLLVDFIHSLYFRHLLVSPKDRRVVVVESLLCPTVFRETLAKVFFRHFEVSSLLFVPSHLVALCTLGVNTALILDMGYEEAILIPVYEGVPVLHAWQAQPRAAHAVESALKEMLLEENPDKVEFAESTVEDIKVRTCFVTTLERSTQLDIVKPPPAVLYREGGSETFSIPGKIREGVYEVLFEQDNDQMSVSTMILDAIVKCPIDMRKPLAENILVIGGTAMAPGFKARLLQELEHLIQQLKYSSKLAIKTFKFHKPPAKENYIAWLGGAIFGGTEMITTRSLTKEAYLKHNNVPDWANLSYNCREEDKISLC